MVRQINEFSLAWESLSGVSKEEGWRSIPVSKAGICDLMAGRRFPGNEESLIIHIPSQSIPLSEKLPEGRGFKVERVDLYGDGRVWLALTRRESGSIELFSTMVLDVVGVVDAEAFSDSARILRVFLGRVRAWQEFMRKGTQALGPEAEIGLIGELFYLRSFVDAGVSSVLILESWVGPSGGIQDFEIGTGAVEVKATISSKGFIAKIGSLEQLDDSLRQPLFLAGLRLKQIDTGFNLPELINDVRQTFEGDAESERIFYDKLLMAGYFIDHADNYSRRFVMADSRTFEVTDEFPRMTLGNVPSGIRRAIYEIDLDNVVVNDVEISYVLKRLGVL
jgi:hypothetical protein